MTPTIYAGLILLAALLLAWRYYGGLRCRICWRGWALYRLDVVKRRPLGASWSIERVAVCKRCKANVGAFPVRLRRDAATNYGQF